MSAAGTSASAMCTVTGTTASPSLHSIITERGGASPGAGGERGQVFGMARMGEAGLVEHRLGDRAGDDPARATGQGEGDGAVDRFDHGGRVSPDRARPAWRRPKPRAAAPAAPRRRRRRPPRSTPPRQSRSRRRGDRRRARDDPGRRSARRRGGRTPPARARRRARSRGPMPAGSPSVSARGAGIAVGS